MQLLAMNHSSYPRVGDAVRLQHLRRTTQEWEKGTQSEEDLRSAQDLAVLEAVMEQDKAGLDLATDGLIRWYDPISHLLRGREGVRINGLLRYFDTNFYVRQPILTTKTFKGGGPVVKDEYVYAKSLTHVTMKPVLTGPLTLAYYSIWKSPPFDTVEDVAESLGQLVGREVKTLVEAGAGIIQIDEPALTRREINIKRYRDILKPITSAKGAAKLILAVYFGDCTPLLEPLQELDVDFIGLDFTYSPGLSQAIKSSGCRKGVMAGLVNGRNTRMENPREVADRMSEFAGRIKADVSYLTTSSGLEFLPRDRAEKKLGILKEARDLMNGST